MTMTGSLQRRSRGNRSATRTLSRTALLHQGHAQFNSDAMLCHVGREKVSGVLTAEEGPRVRPSPHSLAGATVSLVDADGRLARDVHGREIMPCVVGPDGGFEFTNVAPGVPLQLVIDDAGVWRGLRPASPMAVTEWSVVVSDVPAPPLNGSTVEVYVSATPGQYVAHHAKKASTYVGVPLFLGAAISLGYFLTHPSVDATLLSFFG